MAEAPAFIDLFRGRQRSVNDVQINTGDRNTEADWKPAGLFSGGKANLSGFTPGTPSGSASAPSRLKGIMGGWSDPYFPPAPGRAL